MSNLSQNCRGKKEDQKRKAKGSIGYKHGHKHDKKWQRKLRNGK